jgi:DNA invertase Pin-like site-specific DNA recombinase
MCRVRYRLAITLIESPNLRRSHCLKLPDAMIRASQAPTLNSDIRRYADIKHKSKAERNQNIANAFFQGGHTQTAIALAFDVSSSTVSRVIKEFEKGGVKMKSQNGKRET